MAVSGNSMRLTLALLLCLQGCSVASRLPVLDSRPSGASTAAEDSQPVPEAAQAEFDAANVLLAAQQWEDARRQLSGLAQEYPRFPGPRLNLALLAQQQGDASTAERWFRAAIRSDAKHVDTLNAYGVFLRQQGRFDAAEQQYRRALQQDENDAATHRNLGVLYDLYRGQPRAALDHYRRYLQLSDVESRRVSAWIVDLERRAMATRGAP